MNAEGLRLAEKWRAERRGTTNGTKDTNGGLGGVISAEEKALCERARRGAEGEAAQREGRE